jgi:hypothetical protein
MRFFAKQRPSSSITIPVLRLDFRGCCGLRLRRLFSVCDKRYGRQMIVSQVGLKGKLWVHFGGILEIISLELVFHHHSGPQVGFPRLLRSPLAPLVQRLRGRVSDLTRQFLFPARVDDNDLNDLNGISR